MMSLTTFIITLVVTFQLTQSTSPEEHGDPLAQSCVQSSPFFKDYLRNILRSFQYYQSLFILTDCISNFSVIPVALMLNITMLEVAGSQIFDALKPVIVLDLHESVIEQTIEKHVRIPTSTDLQSENNLHYTYNKTIYIIWKSSNKLDEQSVLLQNMFKTMPFQFNTRIFVYFLADEALPSSYVVAIWEMYRIRLKRFYTHVTSLSATNLTERDNFQLTTICENLESFAKRRRNFNFEPLTVSVKYDSKYQDDWVGLRKSQQGTYSITSGYVSFLYWDLKLLMNFSDNILLGDAPFVFANGTLGGITVRQLVSDEIDLTLNQISFSVQRAKALTFLQPTYYSLTYAFFKQPSTSSIRDIVVAAFEKELWTALIGVWAILVISTKLRYKNSTFSLENTFTQKAEKKFANESVLWSVAVFCQKAWYLDPLSTSLRMKFFVGSIFGFLTYTAYSGSIVSSLAVNKIPVKNFFDLINLSFLFTVHEQSEPFQTMLRGMIRSYALTQEVKTTSTIKEISHLFATSNPHSPIESAKVAFLSPADMFYKTASYLNYSDPFMCDHVTALSTGVYPSKSAMLVKKESQFKEVLNCMLIYLRQRGLISRNILRYNTQNFLKCIPMDEQGSKVEPATWTDVFTIFRLLLVGLLCAFLLLSLEIVYVFYSNRKRTLSIEHSGEHYFVGYNTIDMYYMV